MDSSANDFVTQWFHHVRGRELRLVLGRLKRLVPQGKLLDVGCGDGFQTQELARTYWSVGTDYRMEGFDRALPGRASFVCCDCERLPFPDASFDVVYTSNVLEHLEDVRRSLKEMLRVLRPGGVMVHSVPNVTWKVVQILFWYPYVISELVRTRGRVFSRVYAGKKRADSKVVFDSNVKREKLSGWKAVLRRLLPPVHGSAKSQFGELMQFRERAWRDLFRDSGFVILDEVKLPFYSAYSFGFERTRKALESMGFSSSRAFLLRSAK